MKNLFFVFSLLFTVLVNGQYYYKDIVGTMETNDMMKRMSDNKVRAVSLASFDADGTITEGFFVQQSIIRDPLRMRTKTRTGDADEGILISEFDDKYRLIKTVDSSGGLVYFSTYEYSSNGKLVKTTNWMEDSTNTILMQEEHEWNYDPSNGRILKMKRKKNLLLMDEVIPVYDDAGNLVEEKTIKNGKQIENLYYYYNDLNQLTDIVRFNARAQRLLPDYMFEYSPSGQVIQKITVPPNSSDYLIWRYQYDARGIKVKEALYDRYKQVLARIEYTYSYYQ